MLKPDVEGVARLAGRDSARMRQEKAEPNCTASLMNRNDMSTADSKHSLVQSYTPRSSVHVIMWST